MPSVDGKDHQVDDEVRRRGGIEFSGADQAAQGGEHFGVRACARATISAMLGRSASLLRSPSAPAVRSGPATEVLTAQEARVAGLPRDGLSNPEIGARLFISPRTVQYHLSSVFTKLGISSRSQLDRVLPADPDTAGPR